MAPIRCLAVVAVLHLSQSRIKNPSDANEGQVMRAAGKAWNQMLEAAGAGIQSMPLHPKFTLDCKLEY